ncbi:MAG: N-acetyltransferase family protein [Flavobacteriaceae bacterium]
MTKNITIRPAQSADAAHIALLGRITFTETFGHYFRDRQDLMDYYDRTFNVDKIEGSMEKPNNRYWIAHVDRLPVGYAKLKLHSKSDFIDADSVCQLQKIYVLKDFLSLKIGFGLQEQLLNTALELGMDWIWLSVLKQNERAIRFYKKNGFGNMGSHDFKIGKEHFNFMAMGKALH